MDSKLLGTFASIIVGIVVLVSVFIPIIGDAAETSGDPVTIDNASFLEFPMKKYETDMTVVIDSPSGSTSNATTTITIGDDTYSPSTRGGTMMFMSTGWYGFIQIASNTSTVGMIRGMTADGTTLSVNFGFGQKQTIVFDSAAKTVTVSTYVYSTDTTTTVIDGAPAEYIYAPAEDGQYGFYRAAIDGYRLQDMAWNKASMDNSTLVAMTNVTTVTVGGSSVNVYYSLTGGNITTYVGTGYTAEATMEYTGDAQLIDGTTDLYKGVGLSITVTVTNTSTEATATSTFTPDVGLALLEAKGHSTSGATYDLITILPVLVIAGMIIGIVAVFLRRNE